MEMTPQIMASIILIVDAGVISYRNRAAVWSYALIVGKYDLMLFVEDHFDEYLAFVDKVEEIRRSRWKNT